MYSPRVGFATSGGTETVVRELAKRLTEQHDVTIYTGKGELLPEVARMDATIVQIPLLRKEDAWNRRLQSITPALSAEIESLTMFRQLRRTGVIDQLENEDVLSTHYYLDNILLSRYVDVPSLFHIPGIKQPSVRWRTMARLAQPVSYLATSEATKNRAERWLDITVDGIVYPGVDTDQFSPDVEPAFDCDDPVIMYVGRLQEGKGVADLIDAHASLDTEAQLYIVGDGPGKMALQKRVKKRETDCSVTFTGAIQHEEIHHYFVACDVFCLPSYHEGFPVVNLEALASGKPIVSTTIDAIQEQISDGENGYLVAPGNVDALRDALSRLVQDPERREAFGKESRKRASQFTWNRQAEILEDHYERIASISNNPDA